MKKIQIILIILLAFFVGVNVGGYFYQPPYLAAVFNASNLVSTGGFSEVEPRINLTTAHLTGDCYDVSFDVTTDQAYSIARGLEKSIGARPLTHDLMKDMLDIFGIEILQIKIDRYRSDIYYATIIMQKDSRLLELDARPSDSIALAARTGTKIYFRNDILQANGRYIC